MEDKFSQHYDNVSQSYGTYAKKIEVVANVPSIIRVVGDRNDFVSYFESWILCDDGVKRPFIIRNEQGKSILYDIIGDKDNFYRGGFLESTKDPKTNKPKYIWQMKDPELFNIVMYNNNLSGADGSWKSRANYMFNAILRNHIAEEGKLFNWCEENQHTMLFILNPTGFKSLGDLVHMNGKLSEYDIAYLKSGTGFDTKHTIYKAVPDDTGKNPEFSIAVIGSLTEEEQLYGRYNLSKESALKPAEVILEKLGDTIERLSSVMGIDWIGRLQAEVKDEESRDGTTAQVTAQFTAVGHRVVTTPELTAPVLKDVDVDKEPDWVTSDVKPSTDLTQTAPQQVSQIVPGGAAVEYKPTRVVRVASQPVTSNVQLEDCYMCQEKIPAGSAICPKCNNVLMEPCIECGKDFHVSLSVCPHCGKTYDTVAI